MNNVIIGTAGHVDHGKTSLVKALTGIDADRLTEEKKRGITIDIGFAHLDFDNGLKVGIIDVPGHEKFVKNMLAGSGGIDLALLVVDAGEGIMPQTVEHFHILQLLGVKKGIISITKADAAESDWIEMVKEDVISLSKGSFLEGAPIIETSAYTGQGINELKEAIYNAISGFGQDRDLKGFRLPIDRVFSVSGFGTVVTGTLIEGTINTGDSIKIYTPGLVTKARNIQVHDLTVETARSGQRVAINLSALKKSQLQRGFTLAKPDSMENTFMVDVKIHILEGSGRIVKNNSRVHFYHGAAETLAKVVLLDKEELKPGESAYAQLRLTDETAFKRGDRYIIRFYSPMETIGGGIVLNPCPKKHSRNKKGLSESLAVLEKGEPEDIVLEFIKELSGEFPNVSRIEAKANLSKEMFEKSLENLVKNEKVIVISDVIPLCVLFFKGICDKGQRVLKAYHKANPLKRGMNPEEFRSRLFSGVEDSIVSGIMTTLTKKKVIGQEEGFVYLYGFKVNIDGESAKTRSEIEKLYLEAGVLVPNKDEVLNKIKDKNKTKAFDSLVAEGILVMVDKQMFFHRDIYNNCLDNLRRYVAENGEITLAQFRDLIKASRKYAVALLEYWDNKKITKKMGDVRVLTKTGS